MTKKAIVTRAQARAKGLKYYYTGKPCPQGHLAPRTTSSCACTVCSQDFRCNADWSARWAKPCQQLFVEEML